MLNRSSRIAVQAANRLLVTSPRSEGAVMLSAAKYLCAHRARYFAALSMTARTAVKPAQVRSRGKSSLQMSKNVVYEIVVGKQASGNYRGRLCTLTKYSGQP
jgi:hypothetical protein